MAKSDSVGSVYVEVKPSFKRIVDTLRDLADAFEDISGVANDLADKLESDSDG